MSREKEMGMRERLSVGPGAGVVAELAGLHGAFSFPEHLLQRIWSRGDFDQRGLRLRDGRALRLRRRGRWNRLAGPDFADAEIEVGEGADKVVLRGSIEVHLRAIDWDSHGHARDAAYDGVVLHVVLFPSMREWTEGAGGRRIPILELLPLLERDLEAYAEDAAVEGIAGRPYSQLREAFGGVAAAALRAEVDRHAQRRWEAKVHLAGQRIARLGWEAACHQATLEVLGYRANRDAMLAVAERWPLGLWQVGGVEPDEVWRIMEGVWARGGSRPANHPRKRLAQYGAWVAACPVWTARLAEWGRRAVAAGGAAGGADPRPAVGWRAGRKALGLGAVRKYFMQDVCGGALGGSRLDTWVCDAALPLLAAREEADGRAGARAFFEARWRAWTPGDAPAELLRLAREFPVPAEEGAPLSQGDLQGLLGWLAALSSRQGRGT